jgi:hypothetical protein
MKTGGEKGYHSTCSKSLCLNIITASHSFLSLSVELESKNLAPRIFSSSKRASACIPALNTLFCHSLPPPSKLLQFYLFHIRRNSISSNIVNRLSGIIASCIGKVGSFELFLVRIQRFISIYATQFNWNSISIVETVKKSEQ